MIRFLRYAVERGRKIRAVFTLNGQIRQKTVAVICYNEDTVTLQAGRSKPFTIPMEDLLACDYARGDDGEEE